MVLGLSRLFPALKLSVIAKRLAYFFLIILLFTCVVIPTFLVFRSSRQTQPAPPSPAPRSKTHLIIFGSLTTTETTASDFRIHLEFEPKGELLQTNIVNGQEVQTQDVKLGTEIHLYLRNVKRVFRGGERMGILDFTFPFTQASLKNYPFDEYMGAFDLVAYWVWPNSTVQDIPIQVVLESDIPGFKFQVEWSDAVKSFTPRQRNITSSNSTLPSDSTNKSTTPSPNGEPANPNLDVAATYIVSRFWLKRSYVTIGFSLFIMTLNWCLSLVMMGLALQILVKKRDIPAPLLVPPCALLFALPSLRNTQPGAPPIGEAVCDILGLFWNMTLVALSAMIIITCYIVRWKPSMKDGNVAAGAPTAPVERHTKNMKSGKADEETAGLMSGLATSNDGLNGSIIEMQERGRKMSVSSQKGVSIRSADDLNLIGSK